VRALGFRTRQLPLIRRFGKVRSVNQRHNLSLIGINAKTERFKAPDQGRTRA
jgi:hypothetical protein